VSDSTDTCGLPKKTISHRICHDNQHVFRKLPGIGSGRQKRARADDHGLRPDDDQGIPPVAPDLGQPSPEASISGGQFRPLHRTLQNAELMTEREDLKLQLVNFPCPVPIRSRRCGTASHTDVRGTSVGTIRSNTPTVRIRVGLSHSTFNASRQSVVRACSTRVSDNPVFQALKAWLSGNRAR
jgi:hypothetical protein